MPARTLSETAGEGRMAVTLDVTVFDGDGGIAAALYGGTRPHVGGTALAAPGPELHGKRLSRVDLWTATVPGHKDAQVAALVARELCLAAGVPISVTAGIHVDDATPAEIATLTDTCRTLAHRIAARI